MQAAAAVWLAGLPAVTVAGVSPLIVGFALGAMLGNSVGHRILDRARPGINFAGSQILRLAIVLYGFRLTFQDLAAVGSSGLMVSIIMLTSTMVIGVYVGKRIFALDRDTSLLAASGSSI